MSAVIKPDTDSGHWYKRDGSPCYTVPKKSGGERGINLQWDRHLQLVPSVTTVTQIIAKAALENWKVEQGILSALTLPRIDGEDERTYLQRVKDDSKQQALNAAAEGTRIHRAIEAHFIDGHSYDNKYIPHVQAVLNELKRLFPDVDDWVSEKTFAHPLGYGGAVDLHSPSTGIVVDYKGKDGDFTDGKRLAYDQHWQLAAYQVGLGLANGPGALDADGYVPRDPMIFTQCANIFVSRTHPGAVASHVWPADEVAAGWRVFECALNLWRELKQYDPRF